MAAKKKAARKQKQQLELDSAFVVRRAEDGGWRLAPVGPVRQTEGRGSVSASFRIGSWVFWPDGTRELAPDLTPDELRREEQRAREDLDDARRRLESEIATSGGDEEVRDLEDMVAAFQHNYEHAARRVAEQRETEQCRAQTERASDAGVASGLTRRDAAERRDEQALAIRDSLAGECPDLSAAGLDALAAQRWSAQHSKRLSPSTLQKARQARDRLRRIRDG